MIYLPYGWTAPSVPTPTPSPAAPSAGEGETLAENVARVQAAAVAAHREASACPWCLRGASTAACTCKTPCGDTDCEAIQEGRSWKGPHLWRERYGVPRFR